MTEQHQNNYQNQHSHQSNSKNAFYQFLNQFTWEFLITLLFSIFGAIIFVGFGFALLLLPYLALIYYMLKRKNKNNSSSD